MAMGVAASCSEEDVTSPARLAPGPFRPFLSEGSRIPNFLNGRDGEGREIRSSKSFPNTNTSTCFQDRLCGAPDAALMTITQAIMQSLRGRSIMVSGRPRTATARSMLRNDTRHELLKPPYTASLGPGSYHIEGGSPPLGPLAPDSPSRGSIPARDPGRQSRPFSSPQRPSRPVSASHLLDSYLSPEFQAQHDRAPEWYKGADRRAEVTDYRYCARYTEAGKKVATDPGPSPRLGSSGRPLLLADGLRARAAAVPFMSRQPRFALLPNQRHNDVRLGCGRSDEDRAALGPGSYPLGPGQGQAVRRHASAGASRGKAALHQSWALRERGWGSCQPQGGKAAAAAAAVGRPTCFAAGTGRSHKFGPFSHTTDSAQARKM